MHKNIYICKNNQLLTYQCTFNETVILSKINQLSEKNLEKYYYPENHISNSKTTTDIKSSTDLVHHLKKIFFDNELIDLSEIYNLIKSNNSYMRTPQTFMAISHIFNDFNFILLNYIDLENYIKTINILCRHKISQDDLNKNNIRIALNNRYVMETLGIYLNHVDSTIYPRNKNFFIKKTS